MASSGEAVPNNASATTATDADPGADEAQVAPSTPLAASSAPPRAAAPSASSVAAVPASPAPASAAVSASPASSTSRAGAGLGVKDTLGDQGAAGNTAKTDQLQQIQAQRDELEWRRSQVLQRREELVTQTQPELDEIDTQVKQLDAQEGEISAIEADDVAAAGSSSADDAAASTSDFGFPVEAQRRFTTTGLPSMSPTMASPDQSGSARRGTIALGERLRKGSRQFSKPGSSGERYSPRKMAASSFGQEDPENKEEEDVKAPKEKPKPPKWSQRPKANNFAMHVAEQGAVHARLAQLAATLRLSQDNVGRLLSNGAERERELGDLRQERDAWRSESERLQRMGKALQFEEDQKRLGQSRQTKSGWGRPKAVVAVEAMRTSPRASQTFQRR
mmetsp:Transcript_111212/g.192305  ORF Transcript_111212/g.192305 Transcript_111212/m.192305 type:complete len:391 (-) Transcript_111212:78-1250(-)